MLFSEFYNAFWKCPKAYRSHTENHARELKHDGFQFKFEDADGSTGLSIYVIDKLNKAKLVMKGEVYDEASKQVLHEYMNVQETK